MHISGIIIYTKPGTEESVKTELTGANLCEVYATDQKGILIAVTEGENPEAEMEKLKQIQQVNNVVSAAITYTSDESAADMDARELNKNDN